jgi:hypothetical protein
LEASFTFFDDGEGVVNKADFVLEFSSSDDDGDESMSITGALSVAAVFFPRFKLVVRTTGVSAETQITDE